MTTKLNRPNKAQAKSGTWATLLTMADIFKGAPGDHAGYYTVNKVTIDTVTMESVSDYAASTRKGMAKAEFARVSVATGERYSRSKLVRANRVVEAIESHGQDMTQADQVRMVLAVNQWVNDSLPVDDTVIQAIAENRPSLIGAGVRELRKADKADAKLAAAIKGKQGKSEQGKSEQGKSDAPDSPRSTSVGNVNDAPATVTVTVMPTLDSLVAAIREYGANGVTPEARMILTAAVESLALNVTPASIPA